MRKSAEWSAEEQEIEIALRGLNAAESPAKAIDAEKVFELANKAYFLYVSQQPAEQAQLLKMMCSKLSVDAVGVTPVYRCPFDLFAKRAKGEEWSGRLDSN